MDATTQNILIGIGSVTIFVIDILLIVEVLNSNMSALAKLLWILFIIFFPILGAIVYLVAGRGSTRSL